MPLREDLLPVVDMGRAIAGELGLRVYASVTVRVRTWSGSVTGEGTKTDVDTLLLVGGQPPKVRQVSQKDIVRSGGLYEEGDLEIGPLTPQYAGGGTSIASLDPAVATRPTEVFYRIAGPGSASGGDWYKKVSDSMDRPFRMMVTVRNTGEVA
jgi:hypothetical protein